MTISLDWDGHGRVGPVYLGMTLEECRDAIPGTYDDRQVTDDPELLAEIGPLTNWYSDEYGVMVGFRGGIAVCIACDDSFLWNGIELVGQSLDVALERLGGSRVITTDRRPKGDDFITVVTFAGPEVWAEDGIVTSVTISGETDD
jgi:hypothetical protein